MPGKLIKIYSPFASLEVTCTFLVGSFVSFFSFAPRTSIQPSHSIYLSLPFDPSA